MSGAHSPPRYPPTRTPPSPFDRLPNEILMEIFKAFWDLRLECYLWHDNPGSLAALPLCSVSRRWREVALAVPWLWSYIQVQTPADVEWMKFARTRSRHHPITLSVEIANEYDFAAVLPALEDCRGLICDLSISLSDDDGAWEDAMDDGVKLADLTMDFLNAGMPALVVLAVSIPDWPELESPVALLTLDASQVPRLRELEVCNLQLSWMPDVLARLRRLSMGTVRGDQVLQPSEFLDVLAIAQQLEDVSMEDGMPFDDYAEVIAQDRPDEPITIPNLRKLDIHDEAWFVLALLQGVRLPIGIDADLEVYVPMQWTRESLSENKTSGLLPMSIPDDPANVHFLETTTSADIDVPPGASEEYAYVYCDSADKGRFHITLRFFAYEEPPFVRAQCILEDFRVLFRRAPLRELFVTCNLGRISHDLWVEVFRTFPSLCELHFSGEGYPGQLLAALTARPTGGTASAQASHPLLLPDLMTFTLKDFPWHRDLFGAIVRTFEGRATSGGSRMREVRVELCGREEDSHLNSILRSDLAALREHCDVVVYKDAE
ncbi:uncharacterized protein TRAVEDRAFT_53034 [Trametes versicolor FP-101664 SS1]|uniref:uncharacterized protein n=1 Tax=Trametes versicolor (strain FP-101664) TaxID=717944 RepID=UPI0004622C45|nr:uncharacterized protein TRAVEDRAFT_53034 [Trametes versicolor FP-101664 SS1]EIW52591.1 hypothetical protein TRAVEDRAFT_53034 [Trametes versicolor FP-101664 SS1]